MPFLDNLNAPRFLEDSVVKLPITDEDETLPPLRDITNKTQEYIFWVEDREEREALFRFANNAFLKGFAYTVPEIYGQSLKEMMLSYHYDALRRQYSRFQHKGTLPNPIVTRLKDHQGKWIEVELYASFLHSREVFSAFLFCRDLERRLKDAYRYFEIYDNAIDGIFTLDRKGRIKNGNKKVEELTGTRVGVLNEDIFKKFMPGENAKGIINFLKLRLEGKMATSNYQFEFLSPDGTKKYFEVSTISNPISNDEIIVAIRDVTNLIRLEKETRESEEKYRSLVEQSRDIIFVLQNEKVIFFNRLVNELFGIPLEIPNSRFKSLTNKILPQDRQRIIEFIKQAIQGSNKHDATQLGMKSKDGEIIYMDLVTNYITYQSEKALIGTLRNITESVKLEEKVKESEKLGTLAQFAATVAHEIRNPLEALTTAVLLFSRGLKVQGENKQLLDVIHNATNEINRTVGQFLSISHRPQYHFSKVNPKALFNDTVNIIRGCKEYDHQVKITVIHQRGLHSIHGDINQLQKVLIYILKNSCEAISGEGRVKIRLENTLHHSGATVKITIRDSGGGIPANILPHVWEPFVTTKTKGMGVGLFIARRIIEDHGGSCSIPMSNETGTTVQIILPAHSAGE